MSKLNKIRFFIYNLILKTIVSVYTVAHPIWKTALGYYRLFFVLRSNTVYKFLNNNRYYKYIGDGMFKEGNKIIDNGYLALEVPGRMIALTPYQIGCIKLSTYI